MIQKLKTMLILNSAMALSLVVLAALPVAVFAGDGTSIQEGLCSGADLDTSGDGSCAGGIDGTSGFQEALNKVVNIISIIVGVIAVLMIIFGGFKYITSGGDPTKVTSAKNTILYGLIGLIIVALAQIIVKFVLNQTDEVVT